MLLMKTLLQPLRNEGIKSIEKIFRKGIKVLENQHLKNDYLSFWNTKEPLVPPKPKELETATSILRC